MAGKATAARAPRRLRADGKGGRAREQGEPAGRAVPLALVRRDQIPRVPGRGRSPGRALRARSATAP